MKTNKKDISARYPELEVRKTMAKDIKDAAKLLTDKEARFLVDTYYQMHLNHVHIINAPK